MWTLAFEFSSDVRSVAVVRSAEEPAVAGRASVREVRRTPGLALVEAALREAGVRREEITRLAVGLGPGSYTGIRISLALVQGWQLANGTPSVGRTSADVLAEQEWRRGRRGRLHLVVDAQKGDLYHGVYGLNEAAWTVLEPLGIVPASALRNDGESWITPEAAPRLAWAEPVFPDAGILGQLAARADTVRPAFQLEPVYLRETSFVKAPPQRVIPGLTGC
jgi:tRNA threonylcarbamoyl adenosine modification protein YeaZ